MVHLVKVHISLLLVESPIDIRIDIEIPLCPLTSVTSTSHQSPHAGPALSPSPPAAVFLPITVEPSSSPQTSTVVSTTALPSPSPTTLAPQSNNILSSPTIPSLDSGSGSLEIVALPLDVAPRQWEDDRRKRLTWQHHTKRESGHHLATRTELTLTQEVPSQPEAGPSRSESQMPPGRPPAVAAEISTDEISPRHNVRQEGSVIHTAKMVRNQFTYCMDSFLELTSS